MTTVVGANESGKTHLLTAIEKGISGNGIQREDFCRYSEFFTVMAGQLRCPDFGFEWVDLSNTERDVIREACGITGETAFDSFLLFRANKDSLLIYLPTKSGFSTHEVKREISESLITSLPNVFRIDANVALPNSVPIRRLAEEDPEQDTFELIGRSNRFKLLKALTELSSHFSNSQSVINGAGQIHKYVSPFLSGHSAADSSITEPEFRLARDLIKKVAKIDSEALADLYRALQEGHEGYANGIIDKINDALAASLNFPHVWVQDRNFALKVSPREYDLVFTIRDRTATEYSFVERSSGLRYFLSYYIQYLAHEPKRPSEILLMDEPDAYLSSQAQQDLLKIFDAFATPDAERNPVQVVYVTHSPFLIDKNHADRIRVLEKGVNDEGTRVVRDASRNHYEPLRSAFGAFVGETTFIGNCNLVVEGVADQILIAGSSAYLRARGTSHLETLDLNHVTIVPAGSASHVPYIVYLARGRDIERPAIIVLLDSDKPGADARKELKRGGARRKQLLKDDYILQIGEISGAGSSALKVRPFIEIEDLVPITLCAKVIHKYLRDVAQVDETTISGITEKVLRAKIKDGKSIFDAIGEVVEGIPDQDLHIDKLGFARSFVDILQSQSQNDASPLAVSLGEFENNAKALFKKLGEMQRSADREVAKERVTQRVDRARTAFFRDHRTRAKREQALLLLEEMQVALASDNSMESDQMLIELQQLRRDFDLDNDVTKDIENYNDFETRLEQIKYTARLKTQVPEPKESQRSESPSAPAESHNPDTTSRPTTEESKDGTQEEIKREDQTGAKASAV